jgi:hypothetical protein
MRVLFVLLSIVWSAAVFGAPQNWILHNDPTGFTVRHPPGWVVESGAKGLVTVHSADRRSFVVVQPFVAPPGMRALTWIGGIPAPLNSLLPQSRPDGARQGAARPDQALASFTSTRNGEPVRALALVSIYKSAGMLFAIAAPAADLPALQSDLISILGSFSYRAPTKSTASGTGAINLKWTRFREPTEGAYAVEIPSGWKATGSVVHRSAIDARMLVRVSSPEGDISIVSGDADVPMFVHPTPPMQSIGLHEGQWYAAGGNSSLIKRYRPGKLFATDYIQSKISPKCSNLRIVSQSERHDWEEVFRPLPGMRLDYGEVTFTCEMGGKPVRGYWLAGTSFSGSVSNYNTWSAMTNEGFLAPAGKEGLALAVLHHMEATFEGDPRWTAEQQHVTLQVAEQNQRQYREQMAQIEKHNQDYDRAWDESTRKAVERTGNRVTLVDPQTGDRYEAADGHNYYWVDPIGQRTGFAGDIDSPPNVDVHQLMEWKARAKQ